MSRWGVLLVFLMVEVFSLGCGSELNSADPSFSQPESGSPKTDPVSLPFADTFEGGPKALLEKNCVACHGVVPDGGAPPDFRLDVYEDSQGMKGVYSVRAAVKQAIDSGSMPRFVSIPSAEKQVLVQWLNQIQ